jgi:peptidoglycan/LPS O-acetylase OafA/YrhL
MSSSSKFVRYLLGGLIIGGFWYLNRSRPAWEEALRTVVVFTVLMALLKAKLKRKNVEVHLVRLVASKAVLVVIAAVVEYQIQDSTDNAPLVVAIGLGLAVALLGPLGDNHYFGRMAPPAPIANPAPMQRY